MGGLFGGGDTPAPVTPLPPPTRSDAEVQTAALEARQRRAGATGRSETTLTSGSGIKAEDEKTPTVKALLGEG